MCNALSVYVLEIENQNKVAHVIQLGSNGGYLNISQISNCTWEKLKDVEFEIHETTLNKALQIIVIFLKIYKSKYLITLNK